ncbi:MAG: SEC-C domain-containing protein [Gammaproteobacteria bacterium]|nr:SEC-C domain-containing protein [Gammaproteobacteria bacterium]
MKHATEFLDAMSEALPIFARDMFPAGMSDEDMKGGARALAVNLWNVMPLVDNGFRPRPLPQPKRNDPCFCGSGLKYKKCCQSMEHLGPPISTEVLLPYVLGDFSKKALKAISIEDLACRERLIVAGDLMDKYDYEKAAILLEPIFNAGQKKLPKHFDDAFELLIDCYLQLGKPRKKQQLINLGLASNDKYFRAIALRRQALVLADKGDFDGAWDTFKAAQRMEPDNLDLGHLEITLLMSQGNIDMAKQRAQFWLSRFRRLGDKAPPEILDFFRSVIEAPERTFADAGMGALPLANEVLAPLIRALPQSTPKCFYDIHDGPDDDDGILMVRSEASKLSRQWDQLSPMLDPFGASMFHADDEDPWDDDIAEAWVGFVQENPDALQLFNVLDDVYRALSSVPENNTPWFEKEYLLPLLQWAYRVLLCNIAANKAENRAITWLALENRPAVRLMVSYVSILDAHRQHPQARELAEWLVFRINPRDNHGLRMILAEHYLRDANWQAMLKLANKYEYDEGPEMLFGAALAHYHVGNNTRANQLLAQAKNRWPKVYKGLTAKTLRQPKIEPGYITMGGDDQAWFYRQRFGEIWRQEPVFTWLKNGWKSASKDRQLELID